MGVFIVASKPKLRQFRIAARKKGGHPLKARAYRDEHYVFQRRWAAQAPCLQL
jgi:hypothetical protein